MNLELFKNGYKGNLKALVVRDLMKTPDESEDTYNNRMTEMAHFNTLISKLGENEDAIPLVADGKVSGFSLLGEEFFFADKLPAKVFDEIVGKNMEKLDGLVEEQNRLYASASFSKNEKRMENALVTEPMIFKSFSNGRLDANDIKNAILNGEELPFKVVTADLSIEGSLCMTDLLDNFFTNYEVDLIDINDTYLKAPDEASEFYYKDDTDTLLVRYGINPDDRLNRDGWQFLFGKTEENGKVTMEILPLVQADNGLILTFKEFLAMCDTLDYLKYETLGLDVNGYEVDFDGFIDKDTAREISEDIFNDILRVPAFWDDDQRWDVYTTKDITVNKEPEKIHCITMQDIEGFEMKGKGKGEER